MSDPDTRPQNIILAKAEREKAANPMAATDVPVPQPSRQAAPPMPSSGDVYEMVRSLVMSALSNNVTINGQSPEVAGSNVNFSTGETKNASDKFVELNKPETPAETRARTIEDRSVGLEQRLHTPGLDSNPVNTNVVQGEHNQVKQPTLRNLDGPTGIKRGGYAGKGQTARVRGPSKIKQSDRNRTGKDPEIPVKTELPNKVVERDTTQEAKTFARLLVSRADGAVHSLMNVDLSSATEADLDNLPPPHTYFTMGNDKNLNMRHDAVHYSGGVMTITQGTSYVCWRNGLYVGSFDIGSEPPADTPVPVVISATVTAS